VHQPGQSCFVETGALFQMSHLKLHTSHSTLHTLQHSSHSTRHTSHSTLHLISSRLSFSHLVSANLFSSHLISSHMSSMFISSKDCSTCLISSKLFLTHLNRKLLHIGTFYTEKLLHTDAFTDRSFCTETRARTEWQQNPQNTSLYNFVLQALLKALPSTTFYCNPCAKHFYYKAYTDHLPVLLCTTKLARNTSQYYSVLLSLHKALPSTANKTCKKSFPVLLCTTIDFPKSTHFTKPPLLQVSTSLRHHFPKSRLPSVNPLHKVTTSSSHRFS
jgi:hypothetical protein